MSGFENLEKPKSKRDIINEKMNNVEKMEKKLDDLLNTIADEETKTALKEIVSAIKQENDEIIELLSEEDVNDIKK